MKNVIMLAAVILLVACNRSGNKADDADNFKPLSFRTEKVDRRSSEQQRAKETIVEAEIPVAEGDSANVRKINERIFEAVRSIVIEEGDHSANYNDLFANFISGYEKFSAENPDSPGGWEVLITGKVKHNTPSLLNIEMESYTMMGGAHGNSTISSFIFDPRTGNELALGDIVTDKAAITRMAEAKFREKYNVPADQPINSTGLMFENNVFVLPQNVFIEDDGLKLLYNQYEIAPYVDGTRDITLPYDEIRNYLKVNVDK